MSRLASNKLAQRMMNSQKESLGEIDASLLTPPRAQPGSAVKRILSRSIPAATMSSPPERIIHSSR